MTNKDAFLEAVVGHSKPAFVPDYGDGCVAFVGGEFETFENGPLTGEVGKDGFGVTWHRTDSGGGQPVPDSTEVVLENIEDWKKVVVFPDLDAYDWEDAARQQLAGVDRTKQVVEYNSWNAQFLRVTHLMGFVEGICAMMEDTEACGELMEAITDYKIGIVERVAKYFKPDFFTSFDDVATQHGLFISPKLYREIVKPGHVRVNEAIRACGMLPMIHVCGKCQDLMQDFIDEGNVAWSSAQPMNDIAGILQTYGSQIAVIGGYDTNGPAGLESASDEVVEAEVKRCMDEYSQYGSYVFMGMRVTGSTDLNVFLEAMKPIRTAVEKYRYR